MRNAALARTDQPRKVAPTTRSSARARPMKSPLTGSIEPMRYAFDMIYSDLSISSAICLACSLALRARTDAESPVLANAMDYVRRQVEQAAGFAHMLDGAQQRRKARSAAK